MTIDEFNEINKEKLKINKLQIYNTGEQPRALSIKTITKEYKHYKSVMNSFIKFSLKNKTWILNGYPSCGDDNCKECGGFPITEAQFEHIIDQARESITRIENTISLCEADKLDVEKYQGCCCEIENIKLMSDGVFDWDAIVQEFINDNSVLVSEDDWTGSWQVTCSKKYDSGVFRII